MSERLPSGSTTSNSRTPRRFMAPITCNERPSNGCRSRRIVTKLDMSRRWVVCDGFLRYNSTRRSHQVGGSSDCGSACAAAQQAVAESANRGKGRGWGTAHRGWQEQRARHAARRRREPTAREHLHEPVPKVLAADRTWGSVLRTRRCVRKVCNFSGSCFESREVRMITKRCFLAATFAAAFGHAANGPALAQTFPAQAIKIIVPFPA